MFQYLKVSSVEAMKLIHHALDQVSKDGRQIAIAVSGPEGELIAFTRMDGASPAASRIARNKAYTAAVDRKDTRLMNDFMQGAQRPQAYWGDEAITGFGGGVTIKHQDKVIGGMGVSGLTEDEDEEIANKAIASVFRIVN
jgi:glc operon protein GlcG